MQKGMDNPILLKLKIYYYLFFLFKMEVPSKISSEEKVA